MIKIENWSIGSSIDLYTPPELVSLTLSGNVFGHPRFLDGSQVTTSKIVNAKGRIVFTRNSIYKLGKIHSKYREFLRKTRPGWNWRKPVTILQG